MIMKSFNKFLGYIALTLVILLVISVLVSISYINANPEIKGFQYDDNFSFGFNSFSEKASKYEIITIDESKSFDLKENIIIDSSINNISFVEEDREDIFVEYYVEKPDTSLYQLEYSFDETDDSIIINTSTHVRDLLMDVDYNSYMTIHVPDDYECDTLELTLSIGKVENNSLFDNINNLILTSELSDIDIHITSPKDSVIISNELGDLDFLSSSTINYFECTNELGNVDIELEEDIEAFVSTTEMGNIDIDMKGKIDTVELSTELGNISASFKDHINALTAKCEMGSIDVDLYKNDEIKIYAEKDMGDINSDFTTVKAEDDSNFRFYTELGSIDINKK